VPIIRKWAKGKGLGKGHLHAWYIIGTKVKQ
jgi:hypothetical protein